MSEIHAVIRRAQAIREGGHVQRMHTVPVLGDASNARHQWNMAVLYLQLSREPSLHVLKHILLHDVAERWAGDTPSQAKYTYNRALGHELHKVEQLAEQALRVNVPVGDVEQRWVKALDVLELLMFCEDQLALGNRNVLTTLKNTRLILKREWIPEPIREFAAHYVWERTENIIPGEVMTDGLDPGLR